jgi:hypothetical protein
MNSGLFPQLQSDSPDQPMHRLEMLKCAPN